MLVLSRKANETILISDNVTITILKSKGNTVRLGIEAPRDVRVLRGELADDTIETNDSKIDDTEPEAACSSTVPMRGRCVAESQFDATEETRCAAEFDDSDRWSVSSMKRRVAKVCAQRRIERA